MKSFYKIVILALLLSGCAKTATETITDSALQQVDAIEHSITAECKTTAITGQINALRGTIKSQLSACESEKSKLKSDITKWQVISVALFGLLLLLFYIKILRK
jgi:PBP1b-binding outer membrane lipoprotein LpoB